MGTYEVYVSGEWGREIIVEAFNESEAESFAIAEFRRRYPVHTINEWDEVQASVTNLIDRTV